MFSSSLYDDIMNPYTIDAVQNPSSIQDESRGRDGSALSMKGKSSYSFSSGIIKLTSNVHPATAAGTDFVVGSLPLRVAIAARADRIRNVPANIASRDKI